MEQKLLFLEVSENQNYDAGTKLNDFSSASSLTAVNFPSKTFLEEMKPVVMVKNEFESRHKSRRIAQLEILQLTNFWAKESNNPLHGRNIRSGFDGRSKARSWTWFWWSRWINSDDTSLNFFNYQYLHRRTKKYIFFNGIFFYYCKKFGWDCDGGNKVWSYGEIDVWILRWKKPLFDFSDIQESDDKGKFQVKPIKSSSAGIKLLSQISEKGITAVVKEDIVLVYRRKSKLNWLFAVFGLSRFSAETHWTKNHSHFPSLM